MYGLAVIYTHTHDAHLYTCAHTHTLAQNALVHMFAHIVTYTCTCMHTHTHTFTCTQTYTCKSAELCSGRVVIKDDVSLDLIKG